MGGSSGHDNLRPSEAALIERAKVVTEAQIQVARDLQRLHFAGDNTPGLLAAILQAVATNFAASHNKP